MESLHVVAEHVRRFHDKFQQYFKFTNRKQYDWVRDSFALSVEVSVEVSLKVREESIDLRSDRTLRLKFILGTVEKSFQPSLIVP